MVAGKAKSWDELPLILTPRDIHQLGIVGKHAAYALFHQAGFPAVRVGKRLLVSRDALRAWLEQRNNGQGGAR